MPTRTEALELAWAAGFFDGEGSTIAKGSRGRPLYRQLQVMVPQAGTDRPPEVLLRFQRAMKGMGHITPPSTERTYKWRSRGMAEAHMALVALWPYLGDVKRQQASRALSVVEGQYSEQGLHRGALRVKAPGVFANARQGDPAVERAWAAGFLDAEGSFGLLRSRVRKDGSTWRRLRASASQHGAPVTPPAVLLRLLQAVGVGRIERHGEPDDFKWVAEGHAVQSVVAAVGPWLGAVKAEQARIAIEGFTAQTRVRGSDTHCRRGHAYDRIAVRGGRAVRTCTACRRALDREKRAQSGIPPRPFRDVTRRYLE